MLSFIEAVQKRPGMYVGETRDSSGANHLVLELVANALDQFLVSKLTKCRISVDHHQVTIEDDGPGLPFQEPSQDPTLSRAEYDLITPHYSANSDGHAPHVHLNFKGMGLAVVNALCSELIIISRDGICEWAQTYRSGRPQSPPVKRECSGASATQLQLCINADILAPPSPAAIAKQLSDCTHLFPGFDVSLNGKNFYSERGLAALAQSLAPDTSSPVTHKSKRCEAFRIDLALAGHTNGNTLARSWVNGVETTRGGTHQRALDQVLESKGLTPEITLLHIIMERPEFAGPCKDKLWAPELEDHLLATINALLQD